MHKDLIKCLREAANGLRTTETARGDFGLCDEAADAIEDTTSTLTAWFELRTRATEELGPVFMDAVQGYLRTCRSGGMPKAQSDVVVAAMEDFTRLYLGGVIHPFIREAKGKLWVVTRHKDDECEVAYDGIAGVGRTKEEAQAIVAAAPKTRGPFMGLFYRIEEVG